MPNYCFNKLVLKGPRAILKDIAEHRLDFQHYVPVGDEEDTEERRETWGTRSCPLDLELKYEPDYDPNILKAKFMTAWSPPERFLEALLRLFPRLWIKLEFEIEGGLGNGLWILQMKDGRQEEQYLGWEEPMFDESDSEADTETETDAEKELQTESEPESEEESEQVHAEPSYVSIEP